MYRAVFDNEWNDWYNRLENEIKDRISKKIDKILEEPHKRHLEKGLDYFVGEVGQYRITYKVIDEERIVEFFFVAKHKDYERWYNKRF